MSSVFAPAWDEAATDPILIAAVRGGDYPAFGILFSRHGAAARTVARQYIADASDVEDVVAEAFAKVFEVLQRGGGPDVAFRAYLFTVVRRLSYDMVNKSRTTEPTDDDVVFESAIGPLASVEEPALRDFEDGVVARAFESLPERWRSVLWYTDIEGQTPAAIAPIFGLTANGVAALAYRAREGLRQAYLQHHLSGANDPGCAPTHGLLGAYARGGLSKRERAAVDEHLESCGKCRGVILELSDVSATMRAVIAPLVLGTVGLGSLVGGLPILAGLGVAGAAVAPGATPAGSVAGGGSEGTGGASAGGASAAAPGSTAAGVVAGTGARTLSVVGAAAALTVLALGFALATGVFRSAPTPDASSPPGVSALPSPDTAPSLPSPLPTTEPDLTPTIDDAPDQRPPATGPGDPGTSNPGPGPSGPGPSPGQPPTPDPTPAPSPTSGPTPSPSPTPGRGPTSAPTPAPGPSAPPSPAPGPKPTPSPTSSPNPAPTAPPEPSPEPSEPATPPKAGVQDLEVTVGGLVALNSAPLVTTVKNTSTQVALDVSVQVTLPAGARFEGAIAAGRSVSVPSGPALGDARKSAFTPTGAARAANGVSWTCAVTEEGAATCSAPELPAGASSAFSLDAFVTTFGTPLADVNVTVRVGGAGADTATRTIPTGVAPAPAVIALELVRDSALVVGGDGVLTLDVTNIGEVSAVKPRFEVTLPDEYSWIPTTAGAVLAAVGPDGPAWTCTIGSEPKTATCDGPDVAPNPGANPRAHPGGLSAVEPPQTLSLPVRTGLKAPNGAGAGEVSARTFINGIPGRDAASVVPSPIDLGLALTPNLTLTMSASADGTQSGQVTVTNKSARATEVMTVRITSSDPAVQVRPGGDPRCRGDEAGQSCEVDALAPGAHRTFDVRVAAQPGAPLGAVGLNLAVVGDVTSGLDTIRGLTLGSASEDVQVDTEDFRFKYKTSGKVGVAQVGAPLLFCDVETETCQDAAAGLLTAPPKLDNSAFEMVPMQADVEGGPTPVAPRIPDTEKRFAASTSTLSIPEGATVKYARLNWSSSLPNASGLPDMNKAQLAAPGQTTYAQVQADAADVHTVALGSIHIYTASADVTDLVKAGGAGQWSASGIAVDTKRQAQNYAGWALVVVYEDKNAPESEVTVYSGGLPVTKGTRGESRIDFTSRVGGEAEIGIVAWEGDRGVEGDRLKVNGVSIDPYRDPSKTNLGIKENAFDSTAFGFKYANSLGVDVKAFAPAAIAQGVNSVALTSTQDVYAVGALTLTVPLPAP